MTRFCTIKATVAILSTRIVLDCPLNFYLGNAAYIPQLQDPGQRSADVHDKRL